MRGQIKLERIVIKFAWSAETGEMCYFPIRLRSQHFELKSVACRERKKAELVNFLFLVKSHTKPFDV